MILATSNTDKVLLMVIDLTFIHERPQAIGSIWSLIGALSLITLATLSVVPQGPFATTDNWRQFYQFWSIVAALSCLFAFFLYPETYFIRPAVAFNGHVLVQSSEEKIRIYDGWEEKPRGKVLPDKPKRQILGVSIGNLRFWETKRGAGWRAMRCIPPVILRLSYQSEAGRGSTDLLSTQ
jgi:hypothetical protein